MFRTLLLTPEGSYPDGTWHRMAPLPESYGAAGWGSVLERAAARMAPEGVILLTSDMAIRLGLGDIPPQLLTDAQCATHPALESAREAGWKVSALRAWTTFHGPDRPALHVGVLDWMEGDELPALGATPVETAAYLQAWTEAFGVPWAGSASVAGLTLLRHTARGPFVKERSAYRRPRWELPAEHVQDGWQSAADFRMKAWTPTGARPAHEHEHVYDVNKMWLAAAQVAPLAVDALTHSGRLEFSAKRAGFWLVAFEPWTRGDILPDPAGHRAAAGEPIWVTTPRLQLVHELAQRTDEFAHPGYTILDSWTAPAWPVLAPWSKALRTVLDDPDLSGPAKLAYAKSTTTMSKPGRRVYRPDWAAGIVDMGQANLWRKILGIGTVGGGWPVKVSADQVTYASVSPEHLDDIPAGMEYAPEKFGKFKHWDKCPCMVREEIAA